ncbi:MAG: 4Fe-4S binding protein, partial [Candidatus Omnitrophica bacterium]|nr:4Fe-4S binding protein [Candidatus Omnitrophota bacterium]
PHGYPEKGKGMAIGQSAEFSARITGWLKNAKEIKIPVIPKLTAAVPDISFIGEAVRDAGADGLSAINTFPSIMGFDLRTLQPKPSVQGRTTAGGYSGPGLKPIALRCVSDLVKNPGLPVMASGGVSSGFDATEFILIGAPIIQVCTAVMLEGYAIVARMRREVEEFMGWHGFSSIGDFLGAGQKMIRPFSDLNTDYSVKARIDSSRCTGCAACFVSCRDAAYQAIEMKNKIAVVDAAKCTGCSLCFQVCPSGAVSMADLGLI